MCSISCGIDLVNHPASPCLHLPGLPHCCLSFPPTKYPRLLPRSHPAPPGTKPPFWAALQSRCLSDLCKPITAGLRWPGTFLISSAPYLLHDNCCTFGQMLPSPPTHCPRHLCECSLVWMISDTAVRTRGWAKSCCSYHLSHLCSFYLHKQLHWQILGRIRRILVTSSLQLRSLHWTTVASGGCTFKTLRILLSIPSVQLISNFKKNQCCVTLCNSQAAYSSHSLLDHAEITCICFWGTDQHLF